MIDDILEEWNISPDDINLPEDYLGESIAYVIMAEKEDFPIVGTEIFLGTHDTKVRLAVLEMTDTVIERVECEKRIIKN